MDTFPPPMTTTSFPVRSMISSFPTLRRNCTAEKVEVSCKLCGNHAEITVKDHGHGIADVQKAMEPFFTTRPELERSGMGFAFMEAFMDEVEVHSASGKGTTVTMKKKIGAGMGV